MAVRLTHASGGGNACVVLGGIWNPQAIPQPAWGSPLGGLTVFSHLLILTPDNPFSGSFPLTGGGPISSSVSSFDGSRAFWMVHQGSGIIDVRIFDEDAGAFTSRHLTTPPGVLLPGVENRLGLRWRAQDGAIELWRNGVKVTGTTVAGSIAKITNAPWAPLEVGAWSLDDEPPVIGSYSEVAYFSRYLTDQEMVRFGLEHWSPSLLDPTGRLKYHTLTAIGLPAVTGGPTNLPPEPAEAHGTTVCEWTGFVGGIYMTSVPNAFTATHPEVFTEVPTEEEVPTYIPPMHEDGPSLPTDGMELYELCGFGGKRSGTIRNVPADGNLQTVMNNAVRGDDILVALTAVTQTFPLAMPVKADRTDLLMPPRLARTAIDMAPAINMAATVNMASPVTYGGEQVYIRVMTVAHASLPKPKLRDIRLPSGEVVRVLHEDMKIGPAHAALMANTKSPSNTGFIDNGAGTPGVASDGWIFRGVTMSGNNLLYGENSQTFDIDLFRRGPNPNYARRIIVMQCMADGDPGGVGFGLATWIAFDGAYMAAVANYVDRYYTPLGAEGGEMKIFGGHTTSGPFHYELNTLRIPMTFAFFPGASVRFVGVERRNITYRRNHQWCPYDWRRSEIDPANLFSGPGWGVTIEAHNASIAGFTKANRVWGNSWDPNTFEWGTPETQAVMYDTATGIARTVSFRGSPSSMYLSEPWPGAPITTAINVYFQFPFPNLRHNSGTVVGTPPTATFTLNLATVTFDGGIQLPATCEVGHYIYPNDTHHGGAGVSAQAGDNSWGTQYDYNNDLTGAATKPKSQALRQKITAIAVDRLSCTLEFVWPGTTRTFAYSVVTNDGIWRKMPSKSFIEAKGGTQVLVEGNVIDFAVGGGTLHPTSQGSALNRAMPSITVSGNVATATTPIGFPSFQYKVANLRAAHGHPWPFLVLLCDGFTGEFHNQMRRIRRFINDFTVELEPPDPRMSTFSQPTSYTGPWGLEFVQSPGAEIGDTIWRYNVIKSVHVGAFHYTSGIADGANEVTNGRRVFQHDCLYLKMGDLSMYGGGSAASAGMIRTSSWTPTPLRGFTTQDQKDRSHRHNTVVHQSQRGNARVFTADWTYIDPADTHFVKSTNIELNDNLIAGLTASNLALVGDEASNLVDSRATLDVTSTEVRRNLFSGPSAPNAMLTTKFDPTSNSVPSFQTQWPDNTAVSSDTLVGFHNLANTNIDDVTNYALDDIYNTGTVQIDASGTTVELEGGGTFPATVAAGQFFRTSTSTTRVKIQTVSPGGIGFGPAWGANIGWAPLTVVAGKARATVVGGCGLLYNGVALPPDQWVLAPLTHTGSPWAAGLPIRSQGNQTTTYTAYFDQTNVYIFGPAGSGGALLNVAFEIPTGSDVLVEAVGTLFTVSYRSTAVGGAFTFIGSMNNSFQASGTTGLFIVGQSSGFTATEWGTFQTGNYVSGSRVPMATDNFTSAGAASLGLVSPYPETSVTGKSFAIGFKGTGADGKDPGADIPILAQMIQGVTSIP